MGQQDDIKRHNHVCLPHTAEELCQKQLNLYDVFSSDFGDLATINMPQITLIMKILQAQASRLWPSTYGRLL